MQAVVEAPPMQNTDEPVSFKVSGKNIPKPVIAFLDALFPDSVRIDEDDDVLDLSRMRSRRDSTRVHTDSVSVGEKTNNTENEKKE